MTDDTKWSDGLPDDMKGNPAIAGIPDLPTAAKNLIDAQNYAVGAIKMPKADASDEDFATFYSKIGRPESADKYEIAKPELPEGMGYDENLEGWFRGAAHKIGLTNRQVSNLLQDYNARAIQSHTELQGKIAEAEKVGREKHGNNFDTMVANAKKVLDGRNDETLTEYLETSGLGNHMPLIELLADVGANMGEVAVVVGDSTGGGTTASEAQQKLTTIMADMKHPYYDRHHMAHNAALDEVTALQKVVTGEG